MILLTFYIIILKLYLKKHINNIFRVFGFFGIHCQREKRILSISINNIIYYYFGIMIFFITFNKILLLNILSQFEFIDTVNLLYLFDK